MKTISQLYDELCDTERITAITNPEKTAIVMSLWAGFIGFLYAALFFLKDPFSIENLICYVLLLFLIFTEIYHRYKILKEVQF